MSRTSTLCRRALLALALTACAPAQAEPPDPDHPSSTPAPTVAPSLGCPDHRGCLFGSPDGVVHDGFRYQASNDEGRTGSVGWWEHHTLRPPGTHVAVQLCSGPALAEGREFTDAECGPPAYATVPAPPDPGARWGATGDVNGYPCGGSLPPCRVLACESGGNPTAQNRHSSASGLWQHLDSSWAGYGGYRRAMHAPWQVQNDKAAAMWAGGRGASHWRSCL